MSETTTKLTAEDIAMGRFVLLWAVMGRGGEYSAQVGETVSLWAMPRDIVPDGLGGWMLQINPTLIARVAVVLGEGWDTKSVEAVIDDGLAWIVLPE